MKFILSSVCNKKLEKKPTLRFWHDYMLRTVWVQKIHTLLPPSHGEPYNLCNGIGQFELDPSHLTANLHSVSWSHFMSFANPHKSVQHGPSLGLFLKRYIFNSDLIAVWRHTSQIFKIWYRIIKKQFFNNSIFV